MTRAALAIALTIVGMSVVEAQQPKPKFDVVSVKVRTGPNPTSVVGGGATPGVFNRANTTVWSLVQFAYELPPFQIEGVPPWMRTQRFDIAARMDAATTPAQLLLMVQSMLEDRFQLRTHTESSERQSLALVQNAPGQLGRLMRPSKDCSDRVEMPVDVPAGATVRGDGCNTMAQLAQWVSRTLSAPVIDATNLPGQFAYQFFYAEDKALAVGADLNAPSYTTALREQLGLKLESRRGVFPVLVIDSVQQPSEN